MSAEWDGIILGTGHNSIVLHAYLARCGLRVLCLERALVAGGGLATIENPRLPGFRHNTHSFFHRAVTMMPWYRDLELRRHGAIYLEPELKDFLPGPFARVGDIVTFFGQLVGTVPVLEAGAPPVSHPLRRDGELFRDLLF